MMITFGVGVLVGAFIGWSVEQPQWAKDIQEKFVTWWKAL